MSTVWDVNDLEIVGYANVLNENMLPSVVPPVFRLKADHEKTLVPPFSFSAGMLYNATEIPRVELERLRDLGEITLFDPTLFDPFNAVPGFELWIDQSHQVHYEAREEAERKLRRIAEEHVRLAEEALQTNDLPGAERLSGVAISADDRRVEPLALKAAIRRMQGNQVGELLMAELAAPALEKKLFMLLVDRYCSTPQTAFPPARQETRRPMLGMAAKAA